VAIIAPGEPAPEFSLATTEGEPFTRADLMGRTTVLVFYPFAFSPVCNDQMSLYQEVLGELEARGAALYGVSCDAVWSQQAFRDRLGVDIEQLSDFEPKGAACRAFGVLHPGGFAQRAIVACGPDAVVRWSHQAHSPGDLPGANLLFDAVDAVDAVSAPDPVRD
jgi:peroxiredoxin